MLGIGVLSNGYAQLVGEVKKHYDLGMRVNAVKGLAASTWNTADPFGDNYIGGIGISAINVYNFKWAKSSVDIVTPFTMRFGFGKVLMDIGIHIGTVWNYDKTDIHVPKSLLIKILWDLRYWDLICIMLLEKIYAWYGYRLRVCISVGTRERFYWCYRT